jgi:hypothetical protein
VTLVFSTKFADLYDVAGIEDVPGFYRDRFFTGGVLEASYFDSINRFDIQYARTMWIYDNVRRDSSVLDLGCGEGMLALLWPVLIYPQSFWPQPNATATTVHT